MSRRRRRSLADCISYKSIAFLLQTHPLLPCLWCWNIAPLPAAMLLDFITGHWSDTSGGRGISSCSSRLLWSSTSPHTASPDAPKCSFPVSSNSVTPPHIWLPPAPLWWLCSEFWGSEPSWDGSPWHSWRWLSSNSSWHGTSAEFTIQWAIAMLSPTISGSKSWGRGPLSRFLPSLGALLQPWSSGCSLHLLFLAPKIKSVYLL